MNSQRRTFIQLTAAGLLHVASRPLVGSEAPIDPDLLVRQAAERGHTDLGWLDSYHTFSFGRYFDQRHVGFRSLRVINDDRITAGKGFPTHPHRNMEILSYVLDGALQHRDSTGKGSIIRPGDVQLMTAGTGITHSEYNPSKREGNHFLQIWIEPAFRGLRPNYQQHQITAPQKQNRWQPIVGSYKQPGVVTVNQDANIFATSLDAGERLEYTVEPRRHVWLHIAAGQVNVNGTTLTAGDAIATSRPTALQAEATQTAEALLFDLG